MAIGIFNPVPYFTGAYTVVVCIMTRPTLAHTGGKRPVALGTGQEPL